MKRIVALLLTTVLFFTGCASNTSTSTPAAGDSTDSGSGPKVVQDSVFRNVYDVEFTTLDYNNISTETGTYYGNLTICPLVDFDKYDVIQPMLAKDWTVSDDGTVYTFNLRDDVKWRTVSGEEYAPVTAHDFVDTAKWMLIPENACIINANLISVLKNAKEFNEGTVTDFSQVGIKAVDDYTLEYTLVTPVPYFLSMLTYASFFPTNGKFREEMGSQYGTSNDTMLYSGPYTLTVFEPESRRVYERNDNYWNVASYSIKTIEETYNKEATTITPELFLRGEVDEAKISTDILDEWLKDQEKSKFLYMEPASTFTYFYIFNFDPRYSDNDPENWRKAVNNLNFRKSLYHGVDKASMAMTLDPNNPEVRLVNTFVLPSFVTVGGTDYTQLPPLKDVSGVTTYDAEMAKSYKEKAMKDLAGSVTFPVQLVMPYNTGSLPLTNRVQLLEQQLERDLGSDYIDVILVPYPATGYSTNVRNAGMFSFYENVWGPDYTDPMAVLEPFNGDSAVGQRYGRSYLAQEGLDASGNSVFQQMLNTANAEVLDTEKRYTLFAEAERYLIDNAYALPFYRSGYDYYVSNLDPFSGYNSQAGRVRIKYAGKNLLDRPYTPEEYAAAEAKYNTEREAALKAAAK